MSALPASTRLDDLAVTARTEYGHVITHARAAVEHAIRCGEALNEARQQVAPGLWGVWLAANVRVTNGTARVYMHLAEHRELVLASGEQLTITGAVELLREKGVIRRQQRELKSVSERPAPSPRRPAIAIEDSMIEGMAAWLCSRFAQHGIYPSAVTDQVRHDALSALNRALRRGS